MDNASSFCNGEKKMISAIFPAIAGRDVLSFISTLLPPLYFLSANSLPIPFML